MIAEAIAGGIQQAQQQLAEHGSIMQYLRSLWSSRELVQLLVLIVAGTLGMMANYTYKWLRDEIQGSLWFYIAGSYPRRTALAFITFCGYAITTVMSPMLDDAGWSVVINLGLTTGFAIDALINKADRQAWTDEDRARRAQKPPP